MYSVYILYSKLLNRYYIGFTGDDPAQRLNEHLLSKKHFTSKAKDWIIVYTEKHNTKHADWLGGLELEAEMFKLLITKGALSDVSIATWKET